MSENTFQHHDDSRTDSNVKLSPNKMDLNAMLIGVLVDIKDQMDLYVNSRAAIDEGIDIQSADTKTPIHRQQMVTGIVAGHNVKTALDVLNDIKTQSLTHKHRACRNILTYWWLSLKELEGQGVLNSVDEGDERLGMLAHVLTKGMTALHFTLNEKSTKPQWKEMVDLMEDVFEDVCDLGFSDVSVEDSLDVELPDSSAEVRAP